MAIAEDDNIFAVVEAAAQLLPENGGTNRGGAVVAKSHLAALYGTIAGRQLIPSAYVMHPITYTDILNFNSTDLDQVSLNVIVETGQFGVIFGTRLIVSTRVPQDTTVPAKNGVVYLVTTPDKLGRIPELQSGPIPETVFENLTDAETPGVSLNPKEGQFQGADNQQEENKCLKDLLNLKSSLQTWLTSLGLIWEMAGLKPQANLAFSV
jgi:hypothetical protein